MARVSRFVLASLAVSIFAASATAIDPASVKVQRVTVKHCQIAGIIGREIHFVLRLPDDWNQHFFMGGGGGFVGSVINDAESTVNDGYATVGTDTGHEANPLDGSWALDDPERQVNFGFLAIPRCAALRRWCGPGRCVVGESHLRLGRTREGP